jgi:5'-3' exonuclease
MKKVILIDGNNLLFRAYYATAYTGNIFISRKNKDTDDNNVPVDGYRVVKAKFETKTPPVGSTEPNTYNVKQSQSVKVNRMGKNVTNN